VGDVLYRNVELNEKTLSLDEGNICSQYYETSQPWLDRVVQRTLQVSAGIVVW